MDFTEDEEAEAEAAAAAMFAATYGLPAEDEEEFATKEAVAEEATGEEAAAEEGEVDGARGEDDDDDELAALEAAAIARMTGEEDTEEPAVPPELEEAAPELEAPFEEPEPAPAAVVKNVLLKPAAAVQAAKGPAAFKSPAAKVVVAKPSGAALAPSAAAGAPVARQVAAAPTPAPATPAALTAKLVALNRAGHWPKGTGIDVRTSTMLRALPPQRALEILDELEAKVATVKNPSAFVQVAARQRGPAKDAGPKPPATAKPVVAKAVVAKAPVAVAAKLSAAKPAFVAQGLKRPAPVAQPEEVPPAKRAAAASSGGVPAKAPVPKGTAASGLAPAKATAPAASGAAPSGGTVKVAAAVATKIHLLKKQGTPLNAPAIRELASVPSRDALILLQALANRKEVDDPSRWILASLKKRAAAAGAAEVEQAEPIAVDEAEASPVRKTPAATKSPAVAKAPITKAPVTKAPVAKAPVTKAPVTKAPVSKAPVGKPMAPSGKAPLYKAAVAKAPVAKAAGKPGAGKPPQARQNLDFEQMAVQGKLMALNKSDIWPGAHPLDEATLDALLKMDDPHRAIELLDEVEEQGTTVSNPSQYLQKMVIAEQQ